MLRCVTEIEFTAEVFEWRGPAPYHFLAVSSDGCERLRALAPSVTYGWGMVPVTAHIGEIEWTTSLWPKGGTFLLPLKDAVRRPAGIRLGDTVTATLSVAGEETADRDELVQLVGRIMRGEASSEEQEDAWLAQLAAAVPHPRAIDLVLFPEVEVGESATAEQIVDVAMRYRA
jgi:hypothetical protein